MMGLLQGPFERQDTPDTAKSMQATFDEFCTAKANQIELRPKKFTYIQTRHVNLAEMVPPGVLPRIDDPKTAKQLLAHPQKQQLVEAAFSEIHGRIAVHNAIRAAVA